MNYRRFFIEPLNSLDFIENDATADAATKAVLGMISSAVSEADARRLAEYLPDPLDVDTLRGNQASPNPLSFDDCVTEIARQFRIPQTEAEELTRQVLINTKAAVGQTTLMTVAESLGRDWRKVLESV